MGLSLVYLLIFPGMLFTGIYSLILEYADRKLYARLQNRIGPPWFQPFADIIKLLGKETIVPRKADKRMFRLLPVFSLAAASTALLYVPVWRTDAVYSFNGDLIVVLYLLTIPTLCFSLAGWHSTSLYPAIGSVRALTQLFAYEVPLIMALMGPALLADTWSLSGIAGFYSQHPVYALFNLPGFAVAVAATQGKLERVPFDAPEAETEVVAGTFTEYGGRLLALFRMTADTELLVTSAGMSAVFLPFFINSSLVLGLLLFIMKTVVMVFILTVIRSLLARLRIEQTIDFCWKYLAPAAIVQLLIDLIMKGVLIS